MPTTRTHFAAPMAEATVELTSLYQIAADKMPVPQTPDEMRDWLASLHAPITVLIKVMVAYMHAYGNLTDERLGQAEGLFIKRVMLALDDALNPEIVEAVRLHREMHPKEVH